MAASSRLQEIVGFDSIVRIALQACENYSSEEVYI